MFNKIDINCDLGESFGIYRIGNDEEILKYISSANIACGYHAGDPVTMRSTIKLAVKHGVAIGAHPGLPDKMGFGRREMAIDAEEIYAMVLYQIGALQAFAEAEGTSLNHVKPHGALYHMANQNKAIAEAIAEAIYRIHGDIYLVGQSGSELVSAGARVGVRTMNEVFADRAYEADGTLTPRSTEAAIVQYSPEAIKRAISMVKEQKVTARTGEVISLKADTICVHGDTTSAVQFVKQLKEAFAISGITVAHL